MAVMLVLTRRPKEKIVFPSIQTEVIVLGMKGGQVRLGIEAPPQVAVLREELSGREETWEGNGPEADQSQAGPESLREARHRLRNRFNDVGLHLAVLRQQLQQDQTAVADLTISRIEEDLLELRRELEEELPRIGAGRLEEAPIGAEEGA
jgi:carbon storage regulator CsrA